MFLERPPGFDPAKDHESRAGTVIAVAVVFCALSTIFTSLRLYSRAKILGIFCADDWAICVAQIISIAVSVLTVLEAKYALGRHIWVVKPEDSLMQIQMLFGVILGYNFDLNVVKVGFLLLYLRIFQSTAVRTISKWFLAYVALWTVVQMVLLGVACVPVAILVPSMADVCLDTYPVWLTSSIMSTVTDFVIFVLPLPTVWKLNLKPKQKLATTLMFSLGFFTCAVSVYRIFTLKGAVTAEDPTWDNVDPGCWSIIELNVALICSCLPALRPLLAKYIPGFAMTAQRSADSDAYKRYYGGNSRSRDLGFSGARGPRSPFHALSGKETLGSDSAEELNVAAKCFSDVKGNGAATDLWELPPLTPAGTRGGGGGARGEKAGIVVTTEMTVTQKFASSTRPSYQP